MKKIAFLFTVLTAAVSVFAQSTGANSEFAEKLKIAEKITALDGSPGDISKIATNILPSARQSIVDQARINNPSLTEAQLKRVGDRYMEVIAPSINKFMLEIIPTLRAGFVKSYADKFSVSELETIYKFQSSDLGRKLQSFAVNEIPEAMKPLLAASQKMGAEAGAAFVRVQQDLAQEGIVLK